MPVDPCPPSAEAEAEARAGPAAATGPAEQPVNAAATAAGSAPPAAGADGTDTPWTTLVCWNCHCRSVNPANTECLRCRKRLVPPRLVLAFRFGSVELDIGRPVRLGREGDYARIFRSFDNVSRNHAEIGFRADGRPWIRPLDTPNGTFCDGRELPPNVEHPLRNGQQLRFALHAEGSVTVYALPDA